MLLKKMSRLASPKTLTIARTSHGFVYICHAWYPVLTQLQTLRTALLPVRACPVGRKRIFVLIFM